MASSYKAQIWVTELSHGPDSWRGFLYVYLLIFHFTDSGLSVLTGFPFKPTQFTRTPITVCGTLLACQTMV